jgi:spore maturation protein CgeB
MKLVIFNYKHNFDIPHECKCYDANIIEEKGIDRVVTEINEFHPDLIIEEEKNDGRAIYTDVYKYLKQPKALWSIDAHVTLAEHINYAKQFDYVFLAQSWFMPLFESQVKAKLFWLPLCHTQTMEEHRTFLHQPYERDIEFSFLGNINPLHVERKQYVTHLLQMFGDRFFARGSDYDTTLKYLRRSQLTFNCSLNNDLNFRVWEAIACGTLIFTDYVTDLEKIDGLKPYTVAYDRKSPDFSLLQRVPRLDNAENFIKSGHTLTHRYIQLIDMCKTGVQHEY